MKNPLLLAALIMSCLVFGLAGTAVMFIYTSTVSGVESFKEQQAHINELIDKTRLRQSQNPDDRQIKIELEKLNMERVIMPQTWFFEIELVEKGLGNFLLHIIGSAEARKEKLRSIVLERAAKTDLDGCPDEFKRLFRIYASPTGYGQESLQNLRDFAEKYGGSDDFGLPDVTESE
jgi:hypothetical protein